MDEQAYQAWQGQMARWLAEHPAGAPPELAGEQGQAALVLAQAGRVMAAAAATLGEASVRDRNKYAFMLENLPRLWGFQSFSLAEYTYDLPGGTHPGLRLWLEETDWRRRVAVLMFEDVRIWRLDAGGGKYSHELLVLHLGPEGLRPAWDAAAAAWYDPAWGWRRALRQALCLPLLLLA